MGKPIWEMDVAGKLSIGAKRQMKNAVNHILRKSSTCAKENCNSNGACAPTNNKLSTTKSAPFFDKEKCILQMDTLAKDVREKLAKHPRKTECLSMNIIAMFGVTMSILLPVLFLILCHIM